MSYGGWERRVQSLWCMHESTGEILGGQLGEVKGIAGTQCAYLDKCLWHYRVASKLIDKRFRVLWIELADTKLLMLVWD